MEKLIIVAGPTASGKTDYAIKLAKKLNGELINADSRQLYKYLNIGVNKGEIDYKENQAYLENIPIHIIDFLDPNQRYSVFEWNELAIKFIQEIIARGKQPIVVGGTGLFIDSLIKNYNYQPKLKISNEQIEFLRAFDTSSLNLLQYSFQKFTPNIWSSLNYSDQNNFRRLQRLHAKLITGKTEVSQTSQSYDYVMYYPKYNWEDLKKSIENRVEEMFEEGFINEVNGLLKMGYTENSQALQIMGYKEILNYIKGNLTLPAIKAQIKTAHKQYARRQRTWFEGIGRGYKLEIRHYDETL